MAAFTDEELDEFRTHMRHVVSRTISDPEFDRMIHHSRNQLIDGLDGKVDWRSTGIGALWAAQNAFALAHAFAEQGRDEAGHAMATFGATLGALAEGLFTQGELPELVTIDTKEPTMTDTLAISVDQVEANAHAAWISTALDVVHGLCRDRRYFTTDDVHEILDGKDVWTHETRAMGAVMRQAARNGWCQPTMDFEVSGRAVAHKSPKRVWKSTL